MKLGNWLKRNNMSRAEFARRTGLSKGSISQFCNEQSAWVSRETAEQIFRETGGAVTPNDFLEIRLQCCHRRVERSDNGGTPRALRFHGL